MTPFLLQGVEEKCATITTASNLDVWGSERGSLKRDVPHTRGLENYSEGFLSDMIGNGYLFMGL